MSEPPAAEPPSQPEPRTPIAADPPEPEPTPEPPSSPPPARAEPVEPPPAEPEPAPRHATDSWLGSPCRDDSDCGFTVEGVRPVCLHSRNSDTNAGICTVSCEGYCPDRNGYAYTFCAVGHVLGFPEGGLCVAQADDENGHCNAWSGFESMTVSRYVGGSRASRRSTGVCLPSLNDASHAPIPPEAPPASLNGGICDAPDLPATDHAEPCNEAPETWRCGCSRRYQTSVSQVCRHGVWNNYELNPRDCSRCDGRYTRGCEV